MKKILSMLIAISIILSIIPTYTFAASTVASGTCGTNATWTLDSEGTLTISGNGEMKYYSSSFDIPWRSVRSNIVKVVIGTGITNVTDSAFWDCENLISVELPNTLKSIDKYAFTQCENLTNIVLPESLTTIEASAFSSCYGLTNILIPKNVATIEAGAFLANYNLKSFTVDDSNTVYSSIDGVLYNKDKTELMQYPMGKEDAEFSIPNGVKCVNDGAFTYCDNLSTVIIPDSVTEIVDIPFNLCSNLSTIIVNENNAIFSSSDGVLFNKDKTTLIKYPIGNSRVSYVIPESVIKIDSTAFYMCEYIENITFPDNLSTIASSAFSNCTNLTNLLGNNKETNIDSRAFSDCRKLKSIKGVANVSDDAFSWCSNLRTVEFSDGTTSIGKSAFFNCENLSNITLPNTLISLGSSAFYFCKSLKKIVIPEGTKYINQYTFASCSSLESVELPKSIQSIGKQAFYGCIKLTYINLPNGMTTISDEAFWNCSALNRISIPKTVTTIGTYAFCNTGLEEVYIDGSVEIINSRTFSGCSKLTKISIPTSVSKITEYAFDRCTNLQKVYYADTVEKWNTITVASGNTDLLNAELITDCATTEITEFSLSVNDLTLNIGYEETLTVSIMPEQAKMKVVKWSSSDESIATVDIWGCVTGISEGTAVIIAEDESGSYMDACIVEVTNPVLVEKIELSNSQLTLVAGESETLTAAVSPTNATNSNIIWTSSDESIATVENGVITAISEGELTITVASEDGNASASCFVTVEKLYPLEGIKFESTKLTLNAGESHLMNVTYTPENATYKNLTWTSSKPAVATVENGIVKALSAGTTIVVATSEDGGYKATCIITVIQPVKVTDISLDQNSISLIKGESTVVNATVLPTDATNKNIIWTSSDTAVAKVENGKISAIAEGTTIVTATTEDGGYTAVCEITVLPIPVTGVTLSKSNLSIVLGEIETLTATVSPTDAANKSVKWSSADKNIASVDNGIIKGLSVGTTTITVTTEVGGFTDSCEVTVLPVNVTGIQIDKSELTVVEGQTSAITATISPENATDKTVIWSSDDENIATVENGVVTGVSTGTAVIIAKTNDGNFSQYCVVTVTAANVPTTGILLNTSTISLVEGYSETLTAIVKPDNATNKNIIWTSNNEAVATVENGNVTAIAPGTAVIIATTEDGGHIATCIVTVSSVNQEVVSAPVASVLSGIVKENINVILLSATKNADIYYTLDGTAPSKESTKYTSPITITAETKIKAVAVKAGMQDSNISTFNYTLADPDLPYVNVVTNVTGNNGDITTVSVNTTENSGMAGGSFNLVYDNTVVELVSVSGGNIISNANPVINDTYRDNTVRVVWGGIREINAGGEILNAQFRILDTDSEATYFNLEKVKMADGDSNKITLQSSNGILTISEAPTATAYEYYTESTINTDNKSINVNVSANSEQNGILIAAEYDKYGKLIQMKYIDVTNVDNDYTVNFEKAISTDSKIKVFVWSSLGNMLPLSDVEEI